MRQASRSPLLWIVAVAIGSGFAPQVWPAAAPRRTVDPEAVIARLRQVAVPAAAEILMDQVYDAEHAAQCRFDLYLPKAAKPLPLVVYTHGGGWAAGTRLGIRSTLFLPVLERLLASGVAVAAVEYRFAQDGTTVSDCVRDCFAAVAYLTAERGRLGLDPQRLGLLGDSAGGHLAMMLALADAADFLPGHERPACHIRGAVVWYGAGDFTSAKAWESPERFASFMPRLGVQSAGDARLALLSPITHIDRHSPPILCIQGEADTAVPLAQAKLMEAKAAQVGARFRLQVVRHAGHNWREAGGPISPTREEIQRMTADYLIDAVE